MGAVNVIDSSILKRSQFGLEVSLYPNARYHLKKELYTMVVRYWVDYAKMKGYTSVLFNTNREDEASEIMEQLEIPNIYEYDYVRNKRALKNGLYGLVPKKEMDFVKKVYKFQKEIENGTEKDEDFLVVEENKFHRKEFNLEKIQMYYENEYFNFELKNDLKSVLLVTEDIRETEFFLEDGVVEKIKIISPKNEGC